MSDVGRSGMPATANIDMDARYSVSGYRGIAFYLIGYATEWTEESWEYVGEHDEDSCPDCGESVWDEQSGVEGLATCWNTEAHDGLHFRFDPSDYYVWNEPEEVEDRTRVKAVMVGDDRVHIIDVEDLKPLGDLDYCAECGQIGCTGDFRDRD